MAEFTPITTQDELNQVIGSRIAAANRAAEEKYGSQIADLKSKVSDYEKQIGTLTKSSEASAKKYADFDKQLADMQAKVTGYEQQAMKVRIAHESGLGIDFASRLSGATEEDIKADAENLLRLVGSRAPVAPPAAAETDVPSDPTKAGFRELASAFSHKN